MKCSGQRVLFLLRICNGNFIFLRAGSVSLFSPAGSLFSLVPLIGKSRLMQNTASPLNLFCNILFWSTRNNKHGKGNSRCTLGTWTPMIAVLPTPGTTLQAQTPNLMRFYKNMYFCEKYLYTIKL